MREISEQRREQALKFKHEQGQRLCVLAYQLLKEGLEKEYDLTFHDSGMIKSMGNTLYNDCGLIEHQETGGQYPCTYAVEYEKDDDGNVISALIEITNIHDGSISQKSVVFEYTEDYRVSQRTHSAWICYCLSLPGIEALKPYSDILGIFY